MRRNTPPQRTPSPPAPQPLAQALASSAFPSLHLNHPLKNVLDDVLAQVARGKGIERHGNPYDTDADFVKQHWYELARAHGRGFLTGQAEKKLREAMRLPHAQRRTELLGAIAYAAMAVLYCDLHPTTLASEGPEA